MRQTEQPTSYERTQFRAALDRAFNGTTEPRHVDFYPDDPTLIGCAETFDADQTAMLAEAGGAGRGEVTSAQVTVSGLAQVVKY